MFLLALLLTGPAHADYYYRLVIPPSAADPPSHGLCNDGSLPVAYFAPAYDIEDGTGPNPANPNANKWIIFLEGGGACANPASCGERFDDGNHEDKMGTSCTMIGGVQRCGEEIGVYASFPLPTDLGWVKQMEGFFGDYNGMAFDDEPFAREGEEWNRLWLNYCSSDSWSGDGGYMGILPGATPFTHAYENEFVLQTSATGVYNPDAASPTLAVGNENGWCADIDASTTPPTFTNQNCTDENLILFNGHGIVENALEHFTSAGAVEPIGDDGQLVYMDGTTPYPDAEFPGLDQAEVVVLAGGSAGGMGAWNNMDFVIDYVRDLTGGEASTLDGRGFVDSLYSPGHDQSFDQEISPYLSTLARGDSEPNEAVTGAWDAYWPRYAYWRPYADESCRNAVLATNGVRGVINDPVDPAALDAVNNPVYTPEDYFTDAAPIGDVSCIDHLVLTQNAFIETPFFVTLNFWDAKLRDGCTDSTDPDIQSECFQDIVRYSGWHLAAPDNLGGWFLRNNGTHVVSGHNAVYTEGMEAVPTTLMGIDFTTSDAMNNWLESNGNPTRGVDDYDCTSAFSNCTNP